MRFDPSPEQQAIIDAPLGAQRIIACAGSGKTATAVRRLAAIRRGLSNDRSYVVLLSYSNVAVDTFRREFEQLAAREPGLSKRVLISTVDAFFVSNVVSPFGSRVMGCDCQPFLVQGHEPFLEGFKVRGGTFPYRVSDVRVSRGTDGALRFVGKNNEGLESAEVRRAIGKLGRVGAYTHDSGRYWAEETLHNTPRLIEILARRYPHILVDEAQDIGSLHATLLRMLSAAGATISLIGDPHQAIYEFADADGSFLRDFDPGPAGGKLTLTENRRSIRQIVSVANAISGSSSSPIRPSPSRMHGAFYLTYEDGELGLLPTVFSDLLVRNEYDPDDAMILCRGRGGLVQVSGVGAPLGVGATAFFAKAAVARDGQGDIASAYEDAVDGVLRLLAEPPAALRNDLLGNGQDPSVRDLRRLIWAFLKGPSDGIPSATLNACDQWHPALKINVARLIDRIEAECRFERLKTWPHHLTTRGLAAAPLWQADLATSEPVSIRVRTVHQSKGESIGSVLYVMNGKDLKPLLSGPSNEEGRIGYVAITRAKDLLILAVPANSLSRWERDLMRVGFRPWAH